MTGERARLADVAAAAGVSASTASLILNDRAVRVAPETRERVRLAASQAGYSPNSVARGLRTQRTRMIGLVSDSIATTPFAGKMLAGAQDVAREHGYLVVLVDTGSDPEVERGAIRALADHQVDALIYASMWHRVVEPPSSLPTNTVYLDCRPIAGGSPSVVPDDLGGAVAAVRALVAAGHRRIAYVDVDEEHAPVASGLRFDGYRSVLAEAGIEHDPALHIRTPISSAGGRAATDALLDLADGRAPTALFCFNDRIAAGAYAAARHRGLDIPRDLSIVGYDDQDYVASELDPPLTTVALPHYAMGRWAMEVALRERSPHDDGGVHLMPCPIIVRDSVGPPPADAISRRRR